MALAGTRLRSWQRRLDTIHRNLIVLRDEIDGAGDQALAQRMDVAQIDLGECLDQIGATIEICRDRRGKRPEPAPA